MKKLVLLLLVLSVLSGCDSGNKKTGTHLDKLDWQKQLAEAQKNNDYGSCQDVVIAAYLDKNLSVLNKAADICWPIGKNDPILGKDFANMAVSTKEEYIEMVGKSLPGMGSDQDN
ncbi:MAG: hypothetical protein P8017_11190 [Deltaproteobacteria bacterium]